MLRGVGIVGAVSCEISRMARGLGRPESNSIFQIFAHAWFSRPRCSVTVSLLSEREGTLHSLQSEHYPTARHDRVAGGG